MAETRTEMRVDMPAMVRTATGRLEPEPEPLLWLSIVSAIMVMNSLLCC